MKITGLLSWFRESPATLRETILSTAPLIDELVCLDGRYKLFPHAANRSTQNEIKAIEQACETAGVPVVIHQPTAPFDGPHGGEVAKRAKLFQLGRATSPDWFYVFDSDCRVQQVNAGWRQMLEQERELHVGTVMVADGAIAKPHPAFFRALPGLTVEQRHWRYVAGDVVLWDYPALLTQQRRVPTFTHIVVEHRSRRDTERARMRAAYYQVRDRQGIEAQPDTSLATPPQTVDYALKLRRALELGSRGSPGGGRTESRR